MFYEENFKETFLRTNHKIDIHFQIFDETSFSGNFWKLLSIYDKGKFIKISTIIIIVFI